MKLTTLLLLLLLWPGPGAVTAKPVSPALSTAAVSPSANVTATTTTTTTLANFNFNDFGAVGDGVTDNGPALQAALNALGQAGGGTLFVPAGRYAIITPVQKDFTGLASEITIIGVESLTPVPPPDASGQQLTRGLDLSSEFAPRTGTQGIAINISGLQSFLIKDIVFIGTPGVNTDALITLALTNVWQATVRHCEFYGLSTLPAGGSIVRAILSHLTIEQSVFLGCAANSGVQNSVVQNFQWKGITVTDVVFTDYGQRPELFGKLNLGAPYSWISIGNAAAPQNTSPRRAVEVRNVFFDEGSLNGLLSLPFNYQPATAPIDLVYVSNLFMNVSNLGTSGHYLEGPQRVLIENSHYGWSHNADAAINLRLVGNAILDRVECVASANRIRADAATGKLTVIDSVYTFLSSLAASTKVITTQTPDDDPVQYVRGRFNAILGRAPDPAAHFYWSNRLLECNAGASCVAAEHAALLAYLATAPAPTFSIAGKVSNQSGAPLSGVTVTLSGSQSVTMLTGADGKYSFARLPTSGVYTVTAVHQFYTMVDPAETITTPNGDRTFDFNAVRKLYDITVRTTNPQGNALAGVAVSLTGEQQAQGVTDASGATTFHAVPAGGTYTLTPVKEHYTFAPPSLATGVLQSSQTVNFVGTLVNYKLSGRITANGTALTNTTVTLSGSQSGTTTTNANGNYSFNVPALGNYTVTPTKVGYFFTPADATFNNVVGDRTGDFTGALIPKFEYSAASYSVTEDTRTITVTVKRSGDTSITSEVTYSAADGSANQRADVIPVIGRLIFEPGELTRTFVVFITNDSYVEGNESLTLELGDTLNATLGSNSSATLTIVDNDNTPTAINPIDDAQFFVRQNYRDFLNRPADAAGLDFWADQILSCGTNAACIADRRMNVSAAFFLSIEFQETGFLVYRTYRAAYSQPPQHVDEFLLDTRTIGQNLIVNSPGWQDLLEGNKVGFLETFVGRARFTAAYPLDLSPQEFVNQLDSTAGAVLSPADIPLAEAEFAGAETSENIGARARVLRRVAESQALTQRELNPAFVMMQYFGYLQRNPSDPPNTNLDGFYFWLHKLEEFGGDFRQAEMVKSFLVSTEYRARFGMP